MTNHEIVKTEVRYTIMRLLRLPGWIIWLVGFACFGLGLGHGIYIAGNSSLLLALPWFLLMPLGLGLIVVGLSMYVPHQFESVPSESKMAKCFKCGGDLSDIEALHPKCKNCKTDYPLGFTVYLARVVGKMVTLIHVLLMLVFAVLVLG